ncbi:hypothetical protein NSS91_15945 [Caldifermentibacillus hisashii]|uniref:hypothetical protein n=1 Tax=Caldifermentibacillus hisashii TaxID=996558 RepID=UPI0031FC192C
MKKVLVFVVFALTLILTGCSEQQSKNEEELKVNENIGEDMAIDTEQILDIMDSVIEENRDLTERELLVFEQYYIKYNGIYENPESAAEPMTEEEERLFILTKNIIENPELYYTLESDKEAYKSQKKQIKNVIETGQIYDKE